MDGEGFSCSDRVHWPSAAHVEGHGGRDSAIRCLVVLFFSDNDVWRRARFRHRVTSPRRRRVAEHPKCKVGPRDRGMCEIAQCFAVYSSPQDTWRSLDRAVSRDSCRLTAVGTVPGCTVHAVIGAVHTAAGHTGVGGSGPAPAACLPVMTVKRNQIVGC